MLEQTKNLIENTLNQKDYILMCDYNGNTSFHYINNYDQFKILLDLLSTVLTSIILL